MADEGAVEQFQEVVAGGLAGAGGAAVFFCGELEGGGTGMAELLGGESEKLGAGDGGGDAADEVSFVVPKLQGTAVVVGGEGVFGGAEIEEDAAVFGEHGRGVVGEIDGEEGGDLLGSLWGWGRHVGVPGLRLFNAGLRLAGGDNGVHFGLDVGGHGAAFESHLGELRVGEDGACLLADAVAVVGDEGVGCGGAVRQLLVCRLNTGGTGFGEEILLELGAVGGLVDKGVAGALAAAEQGCGEDEGQQGKGSHGWFVTSDDGLIVRCQCIRYQPLAARRCVMWAR